MEPQQGTVARLLASVLGMLHTRFDLFRLECIEARQALLGATLWAVLAGFALLLALAFAAVALVLWVDPTQRANAVLWCVFGFLLLALVGLFQARRCLRAPGRLFAATLEELAKDRAAVQATLQPNDNNKT